MLAGEDRGTEQPNVAAIATEGTDYDQQKSNVTVLSQDFSTGMIGSEGENGDKGSLASECPVTPTSGEDTGKRNLEHRNWFLPLSDKVDVEIGTRDCISAPSRWLMRSADEAGRITPATELALVFEDAELLPGDFQNKCDNPVDDALRGVERSDAAFRKNLQVTERGPCSSDRASTYSRTSLDQRVQESMPFTARGTTTRRRSASVSNVLYGNSHPLASVTASGEPDTLERLQFATRWRPRSVSPRTLAWESSLDAQNAFHENETNTYGKTRWSDPGFRSSIVGGVPRVRHRRSHTEMGDDGGQMKQFRALSMRRRTVKETPHQASSDSRCEDAGNSFRRIANSGASWNEPQELRRTRSVPQELQGVSLTGTSATVEVPVATDITVRGDGKPCGLPTVAQNGAGMLRCISPKVMSEVLKGSYDKVFEKITVIDVRFPFEFHGGHIPGAVNIWEDHNLLETLFSAAALSQGEATARTAVIMHCEFSSHRAPSAVKLVRSIDRKVHWSSYPKLCYPELYLLKGGYEAFFAEFADLCTPNNYVLMLDQRFTSECAVCERQRKRSKLQSSKAQNQVAAKIAHRLWSNSTDATT
eukprot:m.1144561 g.1144561  ORF g.1144561 m.1144561 type:complete len:589 (-) comp24463_c0_seq7:333-2099(-)